MYGIILPELLGLLREQGVAEDDLLKTTQLTLIDSSKPIFLTSQQADTICSNAIKLSEDKALGLKLGLRLNMVALGILGYALMTSATVGDALKILLRYNQAILPSMAMEIVASHDGVILVGKAPHLPKKLERFYADTLYSAVVNNVRILTGEANVAMSLDLDYSDEGESELYTSVFGSKVRFMSDTRGLMFSMEGLATTISSSNPLAQNIFQRECDRITSADSQLGLVSERVKQILISARLDFPTSSSIAKKLHMSESTLQRRLAKEGCRFQELLDQVRYRLALEYLQGTHLPVTEVAILLGYSSAANFRRSFRRWSGITPAEVRQAKT
ncbi:MAG TPA: AraC family transcriptional regulator [Gammaproteobacteria bacterium]|nr:AraC family transcriptional regulator [Gammaproteobacteria bacterium]